MGVEPKIGGFYPQNGWFFSWKTLLKWTIWVVLPLFLVQHPYGKPRYPESTLLQRKPLSCWRDPLEPHLSTRLGAWVTGEASNFAALGTHSG